MASVASGSPRRVRGVTGWLLDPHVLHLNHGSFGATPQSVIDAQKRIRDRIEANPTPYFLGGAYQSELDEARRAVAAFVGADSAGLVLVNNVTAGVNSVLRSLELSLQEGDEIIVTDHEYNACRNAAVASAARTGSRVVNASVPFPLGDALVAVEAMHPDGWSGVRAAIRELCLHGRGVLIDALGIEAPAPADMIGAIASFPVPPAVGSGPAIFDPLMTALRDRHGIDVPVFAWPCAPERLLRISAHLYNEPADVDRLAEALAAELR